jgi:hypothetical protein
MRGSRRIRDSSIVCVLDGEGCVMRLMSAGC